MCHKGVAAFSSHAQTPNRMVKFCPDNAGFSAGFHVDKHLTHEHTKRGTGYITDPPKFFVNLCGFGLFSGLRHWQNRNKGAAFQAFLEAYCAISCCKDCVVFADAYAFTRPELGAALTHDDVTCDSSLAAIQFNAKTTTSGVATVAG